MSSNQQQTEGDHPTSLNVEEIAAHFPHTRKLLEERSPSRSDANHHHETSSPSRGNVSGPNSPEGHTPHKDAEAVGRDDTDREVDDEEAAGTLMEGQDEETARRFIKLHKRRAELSRTVQERLDRATARRAQIQEERRAHLLQVERQRQAKTQQTHALRKAATEKFVMEAPKYLNILRSAGLVYDENYRPLSPDGVELILVSDPRTCDVCTSPTTLSRPVCPTTNQPHRRLLVVAAEKFLKLIGDTRVNLIPPKIDAVGSAATSNGQKIVQNAAPQTKPSASSATGGSAQAGGNGATKAKRGITVNPQLFVLAYYNAVLPDGEVDPLLRDCAISLAQTTEQIRRLLVEFHKSYDEAKKLNADASSPTLTSEQERLLKPLLISFSKEWHHYMRLSNQHILSSITAAGKEEARRELIKSTEDALRQHYQRLATAVSAVANAASASDSPTGAAATAPSAEVQLLSSLVAMLRSRLARVGGEAALTAFDEDMKETEEKRKQQQQLGNSTSSAPKRSPADDTEGGYNTSPAVTPEHHPSAAPLLTSSSTDGNRNKDTILPTLVLPSTEAHQYPSSRHSSEVVLSSPMLGPPAPPNTPDAVPFTRVPSTATLDDINPPLSRQSTGAPIGSNASPNVTQNGGAAGAVLSPTKPKPSATTWSNEYLGTSGSDTDLGGALPRRVNRPIYGPPLPPLWTVDAQGRSQPPSADVLQQEKRSKLEYRARAAYTARLKRDAMATKAEAEERLQRETLGKAFDDVMWDQFRRELDEHRPPILGRIPHLLNAVSESLIEALPRRIRARVGQEIRDVLDWDVLKNRLKTSSASVGSAPQRYESITSLVTYVINRVGQLGAPAREEELHAQAQSLVGRLSVLTGSASSASGSPTQDTIGKVIVEMFQFMFESIRQLRQDIATYSLQMVSQELASKASEYEKEFTTECLPPVSEWTTTKAFLQKGASDATTVPMVPSVTSTQQPTQAAQLQTIQQALPSSVLYVTETDKKLFAAVLAGAVDLLRSSGKETSTRWLLFPKESFYFARPLIFEAANAVQLSTLRLMLSGTVSMILAPRKIHAAALQQFLLHLDGKVVQWLEGGKDQQSSAGAKNKNDNEADNTYQDSPVHTIEDLKKAITEEISIFLGSKPQLAATSSAPTPTTATSTDSDTVLPEADIAVLHGVISKMAETNSPQYTLFETRILRAIASIAINIITLSGSGLTTAATPAPHAATSASAVGASSIAATAAAAEAALRACGSVVTSQVREVGATIASIILQNWEVHRTNYAQIGLENNE